MIHSLIELVKVNIGQLKVEFVKCYIWIPFFVFTKY